MFPLQTKSFTGEQKQSSRHRAKRNIGTAAATKNQHETKVGEGMTRRPLSLHADLVSRQTPRYRIIHVPDLPFDHCRYFGRSLARTCMGRVRLARKSRIFNPLFLVGVFCKSLRSPVIWSTQEPSTKISSTAFKLGTQQAIYR